MSNLQPGDLAIFLPTIPRSKSQYKIYKKYNKEIVEILDFPGRYKWNKNAYSCQFKDGRKVGIIRECLKKIEPPKKREETVDWSTCPWQPEKVYVE